MKDVIPSAGQAGAIEGLMATMALAAETPDTVREVMQFPKRPHAQADVQDADGERSQIYAYAA